MRNMNDYTRQILKLITSSFCSKEKKDKLNYWLNHKFPPSTINQITFRAADGCNLRCKMCHYSKKYRKGQKIELMDLDLVKKVIDESKGSVLLINFSGSGEPLLNPEIDKMVEYANQSKIKTQIGTNASLLTKELSTKLLSAGLSILKVSIDGATKETYEKIRVGTSFDKLIENLDNFQKIRNKMNKETRITVNTVITTDNQYEIDDIKKVFGHVTDKFAAKYPCTFGIMPDNCNYSPRPLVPKKCNQLVKRMTIIPDGRVTICCGDNQNLGVVGNVKEKTPIEIWNSDLYNELRGYHRTGQLHKIPLCKNCLDAGDG